MFQPLGYYVAIEDPEALRILLEKITTDDGVGLTREDIASVKTMGNWWKGNTAITSFAELKDFGLTSLGSSTFEGCVNLATLELPTTLTRVLAATFYKVPANFELHMPNAARNALSESGGAFARSGVTKVVIGGEATSIEGNYTIEWLNSLGLGAFSLCNSLEEVILPDTMKVLGSNSFAKCPVLVRINLPEGLTTIYGNAFRDSVNLVIDKFPESLTYIGGDNFYQNKNLPEVINLPNLQTLGAAFMKSNIKRAENLGKITTTGTSTIYWPTSYGAGPFSDCKELEFVEVPATVTNIGTGFVAGCTALKEIVLRNPTPATLGTAPFNSTTCPFFVPNESVEAYKSATGWSAFASRIYPLSIYEAGGLANLITFADPAVEAIVLANWDNGDGYFMKSEAEAVTDIGRVFQNNTEITSFNEFENFVGVTSLVGGSSSTRSAFSGCSNLASIKLPPNLTSFGQYSFSDCSSLVLDSLSKNVTVISDMAFGGIKQGPENIVLPNLTYLGGGAFTGAAGIKRVLDLGGITQLVGGGSIATNSSSFRGCADIEVFIIPDSVTTMGKGAISLLPSLHTLISKSMTPPTYTDNSLYNLSALTGIYVPDAAVDAYKAASGWAQEIWASKIKGISQLATDNPTLYAEIEEYL